MAGKMEVDSEEKKSDVAAVVAALGGGRSLESSKTTVTWDDFDVGAYAARYEGKVKIDRLLHVVDAVDSPRVRTRAIELAVAAVRRAEMIDVGLYGKVMEKAVSVLGAAKVKIDADWMQRTSVENDSKARLLEDEIQRWRNLSNREKICGAYLEAGAFYCAMGSFSTAVSRIMEAKSFASDATLLLSIHMKIIAASIESGSLSHVRSEASQAMASESVFYDDTSRAKALVAAGLCLLRGGRFEAGISNLAAASFALNGKWKAALSGEDIALYGGVCALASLSRADLKKRVLDNSEFKRFLALRPDLFKLVSAFYESEYGSVMHGLKLLQRELVIDPFTHSAVDSLLTAIRGKALVQYFSPYSVMDMNRMAEAFKVTLSEMEKELSTCVADGHINAKIDSYSKIVYAAKHDKRRKLFRSLIKLGDDFERDVTGVLLRMSLQKHSISVSQTRELLDRMDDEEGGGVLGSMARVGGRVLGFGGGGRRGL